jgi:hypothetical protein
VAWGHCSRRQSAALVQHHPFDYDAFVEQVLVTGATVTALPTTVLGELALLKYPQCRLKRIGCVWSVPNLSTKSPPPTSGKYDRAGNILRNEILQ